MYPPDPNFLAPPEVDQSMGESLPPNPEMDPAISEMGLQPQDPSLLPIPEGMEGLEAAQPPVEEELPLVADSDEARLLSLLLDEYLQTEEGPRNINMKIWRKHINYWDGIQYTAWNESTGQWRTPEEMLDDDPQSDIDPSIYAKVVNVYKAHGEILIGALSAGIPTTIFYPLDADDHEDIQTSKAHTKIAELIQRHNKAKLLLMKSLYILYNCGFVACYNENKTDYRFGSYKTPVYEDVPIINRSTYCPGCGNEMGQEVMPQDAPVAPPPQPVSCQDCGYQGVPEVEDVPGTTRVQTGEQANPKNRECLEIYGPLNVKIPLWVKEMVSTPYVVLEDEFPIALMREIYPEYADKIQSNSLGTYESEVRVPSVYKGDFPDDMCTVQRVWFQPWALNLWNKEKDTVIALKEQFKEGLYFVRINDKLVVEIVNDSLHKHWTMAEHQFSETLHAQPIGAPMVPLQDIENELDNLTLETIEFGLPELFADPKVLDFTAYQRQEIRPGQVSPASAPSGRSLGEGFHEVKATTLSREVDLFASRMNDRQQFVQGTYPSIYGGAQEGSGGTAREYELSKASALQRLSSTWTILQEWWCMVMDKSTKSFVANMKTDEKFVKSRGSNFINVWIRQSELSGEIGEVVPEVAEPFPISWTQKRDIIMNLLQLGNEDIAMVMRHPENSGVIASVIGLSELHIPGDDSRNKQLYEINQLINTEPMMGSSQTGEMQSSVPVDPILDDHNVESEICKAWLRSEVGLYSKTQNPAGYMNVLAHMKEHEMIAMQMAQMGMEQEAAVGEESAGYEGEME
jgi:hypothetical protein